MVEQEKVKGKDVKHVVLVCFFVSYLIQGVIWIQVPPGAVEPLFFPIIRGKLQSHASLNTNGPFVFNVNSFGVVGDGVSDDTKAFNLAQDATCHAEFLLFQMFMSL